MGGGGLPAGDAGEVALVGKAPSGNGGERPFGIAQQLARRSRRVAVMVPSNSQGMRLNYRGSAMCILTRE